MPGSRGTSAAGRRVRVAVASDQRLVAEAVAAALADRDFDAVGLEPPHQLGAAQPDVAVLLHDLGGALRLSRALAIVESWAGPWLVLTRAPPGAAWGALVSGGARIVLSRTADLTTVEQHLRSLAAGEEPAESAATAAQVAAWREVQARHDDLHRRIATLAPRELDVLELICRGVLVVEIARQRGLAETTVRAQVRAVLRKLGVPTQLAATALLRAADEAVGALD